MYDIYRSYSKFQHLEIEGSISVIEAIHQFSNAIRAAGLEPPESIEPGRFHRFSGAGKKDSNRAAWCMLFPDGHAGVFGDWSSGLKETWKFLSSTPRTKFNPWQSRYSEKMLVSPTSGELIARQKNAARTAKLLWRKARPVNPLHPYLMTKGVRPYVARQLGESLVLPITTVSGDLSSLQFILTDGSKRMLTGGAKRGRIIPVRWLGGRARIVVSEGYSTAATLAELYPARSIFAAIDAGNLLPACTALRSRFPEGKISVYGDDDRRTPGNPGRTKANEAARASGAKVAFPPWDDAIDPREATDWNDWARVRELLRGGVTNACTP